MYTVTWIKHTTILFCEYIINNGEQIEETFPKAMRRETCGKEIKVTFPWPVSYEKRDL